MAKVQIPQADEQQRLLANLLTQMSADRIPLPRFWYLPRGEKAAVIMTGDDHGGAQTAQHFDRFVTRSPAGCSVADWRVRARDVRTSSSRRCPNAEATSLPGHGFEVALHLNTGCENYDCPRWRRTGTEQLLGVLEHLPGYRRRRRPTARTASSGATGPASAEPRRANGDPARHELLLLAGQLGAEPARRVHRLGLPDALRRHRRRADRRLPGGDADHRRVGRRLLGAHRDALGQRDRQGLLRRVHDELPHRRRPDQRARSSSTRRGRVACR